MSINSGFTNEKTIIEHLDGYKISDLNANLRSFIEEIFAPTESERDTCLIRASKTSNLYKPDIIIEYAGRTRNISVKIGSGNSVHQESITDFVKYLASDLGASSEVINALLFFHWGDGTLDGSAKVTDRMDAKTVIKKYPAKITIIQDFFNQHIDALLERFLSTGTTKLSHVDYIYYGDYENATWHSIAEVYDDLKSHPAAPLSVAGLNYQTYGRSLQGKDDDRRNSIQLKWGNMQKFFSVGPSIASSSQPNPNLGIERPSSSASDTDSGAEQSPEDSSTDSGAEQLPDNFSDNPSAVQSPHSSPSAKAIEGLGFEHMFTSLLNRDKTHPLWGKLDIHDENTILINVSYTQISKLTGAKINPKSDCYIVKLFDDVSTLLIDNNYVITEEILHASKVPYEIIKQSGISIKLPGSTSYTLQKLSFVTFKEIFNTIAPEYFIAALLYSDNLQIDKNTQILADFDTTLDVLCRQLEVQESDPLTTYTELKNKSLSTLKRLANNDSRIHNIICFGDEIFDDPYCASYIYENGELLSKKDFKATITVTTGSGRSHGTYTLAFK